MDLKKLFARAFFATALGAMLVSVFDVPVAQAQDELDSGLCYDGDRKMCMKKPVQGGGEMYYYWV